jgi:hypothetical protein
MENVTWASVKNPGKSLACDVYMLDIASISPCDCSPPPPQLSLDRNNLSEMGWGVQAPYAFTHPLSTQEDDECFKLYE